MFDPIYLKQCFHYDPENGRLSWKERPPSHFKNEAAWKGFNKRFAGRQTPSCSKRYDSVAVDGETVLAHRVIWAIEYGVWPDHLIDHADGIKKNNRLSNLRAATTQQNRWNSRHKKPNLLGFKGVGKQWDKYRAAIKINGRTRHLGVYDTPEEAHEVWCLAADLLHGEFASHQSDQGERR